MYVVSMLLKNIWYLHECSKYMMHLCVFIVLHLGESSTSDGVIMDHKRL